MKEPDDYKKLYWELLESWSDLKIKHGCAIGEAEQLRKERDELEADRYKLADALVFLQSTIKFNHPIMELAKKVTENGN